MYKWKSGILEPISLSTKYAAIPLIKINQVNKVKVLASLLKNFQFLAPRVAGSSGIPMAM